MPVVVAAGYSGLQGKPSSSTKDDGSSQNQSQRPRKKKKKRIRGGKQKQFQVLQTGEDPTERKMSNGQVRKLDLLRKNKDHEAIPRKAREFMERMARMNAASDGKKPVGRAPTLNPPNKKAVSKPGFPGSGEHGTSEEKSLVNPVERTSADSQKNGSDVPSAFEGSIVQREVNPNKPKQKFDGMQPGESFSQFSTRLRKESKQMINDMAKKGSHQREKRKAYHEKRKERLARKKRRRRGEYIAEEEDELEHADDENENSICHLPMYWQDIVNNNGRPISEKKRRRLDRLEREETDRIAFGEQAERPPEFKAVPKQRSRAKPS